MAIQRPASHPSARRRVGSIVLAPVAAVGWVMLGLLELAVRIALFRKLRNPGATSVIWGIGFALFLWFGLWALGVHERRAIPFAVVAGTAIALFIYRRGSALENPPVGQPGAYHRRLLARYSTRAPSIPSQLYESRPYELVQAEVALDEGDYSTALYWLREAERVAVAQRKLDELLEARGLVGLLSTRSRGSVREAGEHLARKITRELQTFPADELASAGVRGKPEDRRLGLLLARPELRAPAGDQAPTKTRELTRARGALEGGDPETALFLLEEAERVAVAQRRLDELLEVYELVRVLSERRAGPTHEASERLAGKVEVGLLSFERAEDHW